MQDVITRLRRIDDELPADDGAAVFNRMYLTVTETVAAGLAGDTVFVDPAFMEQLDVTFASLWIEAYDADVHDVPRAWAALFERRHDRAVLPVQFALAGMNSHIGHDLAVAVVQTCRQRATSPEEPGVRDDYEAVNRLLAACESKVRRSFLTAAGQELDAHVGPVVHLVSSWKIDKARDVAWVNVEAMWAIRHVGQAGRPLPGRSGPHRRHGVALPADTDAATTDLTGRASSRPRTTADHASPEPATSRSIAARRQPGASCQTKWPAPGSTCDHAPGMRSALSVPAVGGIGLSSPTITPNGT